MRVAAIMLASALLAGCQETGSAPAEAQAQDGGGVSEAKSGGAETPCFVGRWAAKEEMCGNAAWEITGARLSTPGHTVCDFDQVKKVEGIYRIDATCTAEGPPAEYELRVSYAQSAKALLIEGGPMEPIGLVACD